MDPMPCFSHVIALTACLAPGAKPSPKAKFEAFGYHDVQLTGGPLAAQAEIARKFYLGLDEDSLLQGFRIRAGLPAPGRPMGGWYDPDGFAAAHPFGQYVSALARMYADTRDPRYKAKVARLVHGFNLTIRKDGYFYASEKVAKEWPCYLYDKSCTAMRDAFGLTGNLEALIALKKMTDWAYPHLPRRSDEWYTLPENLYKCYSLTRDQRYLKMAAEYDYSLGYYDDFASGENAFLPTRHAYSHVNSLSSAARAYEFGMGPKYLKAIENAWSFLTTTQMYASGGWGPDEHFVLRGDLAKSLDSSEKNFETPCGAYANVNLDRYLIRFTGDAKYGDNMERVLLNGMLSALPPAGDGHSFYYSNYRAGAQKTFFPEVWPCCSGTYAEITADYPTDIYFHSKDDLIVNLYATSQVRWNHGSEAIELQQTAAKLTEPGAKFRLHLKRPARFGLCLRIPDWSGGLMKLTVNGRRVSTGVAKGFAPIRRRWRDGDLVEISFGEAIRLEPIDRDHPDRVALMVGPLLYVALADGPVTLAETRDQLLTRVKAQNQGPESRLEYRLSEGLVFRPLFLVQNERYTTYLKVKLR
jgi:DUF1680 family protein